MRALVLHEKGRMAIEQVDEAGSPGPGQVRIAMHTVGICASDVHYWTDGKIGPFVVEAPMILGHEGSGTVTEVGEASLTSPPVTASPWSPACRTLPPARCARATTTSTPRCSSGRPRRSTAA